MSRTSEPLCPGCKEVPASRRQKTPKQNRCDWSGYDHDTGQVATFQVNDEVERQVADDFFRQGDQDA